MSWIFYTIFCVLSWGLADIFYKKGAAENDKLSHFKQAVWVGLVMGVFAIALLFFASDGFTVGTLLKNMLSYSPASLAYIISMVIGYAGLRYLELSIISPVQNASGAFSMIFMIVFFAVSGRPIVLGEDLTVIDIIGTGIITIAIIALAIVENKMAVRQVEVSSEAHKSAGAIANSLARIRKYRFGAKALLFPILYCVFDTIGTSFDGIILEDGVGLSLSEIDVLILYGLTFFLIGLLCFAVVSAREGKLYNPFVKSERSKMCGAIFEEGGQIFYVYAMAKNPVVAAPVISSYCVISVLLSRVLLKEQLRKGQCACILLVIIGIILLGISEGINL